LINIIAIARSVGLWTKPPPAVRPLCLVPPLTISYVFSGIGCQSCLGAIALLALASNDALIFISIAFLLYVTPYVN
uniref:hypothetical protein n=1 Tax=Calothrix rhizosoleniae TaxID=888997 RepID=UPI0013566A77